MYKSKRIQTITNKQSITMSIIDFQLCIFNMDILKTEGPHVHVHAIS